GVTQHRAVASVVRGDREGQVPVKLVRELAKQAHAAKDVVPRIQEVSDLEALRRLRHKLHEATSAGAAHGARIEVALATDDRPDEGLGHLVERRGLDDPRIVPGEPSDALVAWCPGAAHVRAPTRSLRVAAVRTIVPPVAPRGVREVLHTTRVGVDEDFSSRWSVQENHRSRQPRREEKRTTPLTAHRTSLRSDGQEARPREQRRRPRSRPSRRARPRPPPRPAAGRRGSGGRRKTGPRRTRRTARTWLPPWSWPSRGSARPPPACEQTRTSRRGRRSPSGARDHAASSPGPAAHDPGDP